MDQEKFGKLIKEIRKKHGLTQSEFAQKYNVTYQAVSKWENGKNMPDISLIKQISKDFNVSLDELFGGKIKKKNRKVIFIIMLLIILSLIISFVYENSKNDFVFKTLTSTCDNFSIKGNIAYNKTKSAIYITNIEYCGNDKDKKYNNIECSLYEKKKGKDKKISTYKYNKKERINLETFLKDVTLTINNYEKACKSYTSDTLYLKVKIKNGHKTISYKIPLALEDTCTK